MANFRTNPVVGAKDCIAPIFFIACFKNPHSKVWFSPGIDAESMSHPKWLFMEDKLPTTFGFVPENTYYKITSVKNKTIYKEDDNRN